jgi:hypothetical protein
LIKIDSNKKIDHYVVVGNNNYFDLFWGYVEGCDNRICLEKIPLHLYFTTMLDSAHHWDFLVKITAGNIFNYVLNTLHGS